MVAYRLSTYGNPLRTEPARRGGRYHTGTEASPTQYLCLHPLGPLAEFMRNSDFRTPDQLRHVRQRLWALRVDLDEVPEITFDNADEFGIGASRLIDDDQSQCRALGSTLRDDISAIVVPSAALPGTRNLVLFGPRIGSPYLLDAVSAVDVPASITAHAGRPIMSLLDVVRFKGDSHRGLDAWSRGEEFSFAEPSWELTNEYL